MASPEPADDIGPPAPAAVPLPVFPKAMRSWIDQLPTKPEPVRPPHGQGRSRDQCSHQPRHLQRQHCHWT